MQEYKLNIYDNSCSLKRLKLACEKCKRELSTSLESTFNIDCLIKDKDFNIIIFQNDFEFLCMNLFNKCINLLRNLFTRNKFW